MYRYGTRCPFPGLQEQRILEEDSPCYSPCSLSGVSQREGMLQGWDCRKTHPLLGPPRHVLHPPNKKPFRNLPQNREPFKNSACVWIDSSLMWQDFLLMLSSQRGQRPFVVKHAISDENNWTKWHLNILAPLNERNSKLVLVLSDSRIFNWTAGKSKKL